MERMYFIGVSTGSSTIMGLFPRWAAVLGLNAEIVGVDLPLGVGREQVREALIRLSEDPAARGGLVTTHKVAVVEHAGDLFSHLDGWAGRCREVSCLVKRDGGLVGYALDPIISWRSFTELAGSSYFSDHPSAEVLCLGAGGSGTALVAGLQRADAPPARIHVTDTSPDRLDFLTALCADLGSERGPVCRRVDGARGNDAVVESLPPWSVVVNATGMGKDRPGSPLTDRARLPLHGIAWDFNYRGTLEFLHQARRQRGERSLMVEDGWRYFVLGWSEHIATVFGLELAADRLEELAAVAADVRRPRS